MYDYSNCDVLWKLSPDSGTQVMQILYQCQRQVHLYQVCIHMCTVLLKQTWFLGMRNSYYRDQLLLRKKGRGKISCSNRVEESEVLNLHSKISNIYVNLKPWKTLDPTLILKKNLSGPSIGCLIRSPLFWNIVFPRNDRQQLFHIVIQMTAFLTLKPYL